MNAAAFWQGKKVFLTGHTGFKGAWLSIWLSYLGATVTGYALQPPTRPSLFELAKIDCLIESIYGDIRDAGKLQQVMGAVNPDIVIHMAAQPLVRASYRNPIETYETNVMGTVYVLEAVRQCSHVKAVLNITTDKCYENKDWLWGYRENDSLGGYDPYSNSKACSELVTAAYRSSFFNSAEYEKHGIAVATARAGNVIGGGDWAEDRLVPDCVRSLLLQKPIVIRQPYSIRPWQHVLEPLSGYLLLLQRLYQQGPLFGEAWNFGPEDQEVKSVEWIVKQLCTLWEQDTEYVVDLSQQPHEANYLKLDCSKTKMLLGWKPHWNLMYTLEKIVEWFKKYENNDDITNVCWHQIKEFEG